MKMESVTKVTDTPPYTSIILTFHHLSSSLELPTKFLLTIPIRKFFASKATMKAEWVGATVGATKSPFYPLKGISVNS